MVLPTPWRTIFCNFCLGQLLALLSCATSVFSALLVQRGAYIPTTQCFLNYLLLFVIYTPVVWHFAVPSRKKQPFSAIRKFLLSSRRIPWYLYATIALADVEANYLVVKAFQYTDLLCVQLLSCFSVPCAMVLSVLALQAVYTRTHFIGVVLCLVGLGLLLTGDSDRNPLGALLHLPTLLSAVHRHLDGMALWGDGLCLVSGLCYAMSNVGQEYVLKTFGENPDDEQTQPLLAPRAPTTDRNQTVLLAWFGQCEFLAGLGFFGALINGAQLLYLEGHLVFFTIKWSVEIVGLVFGFALALFLLYSLTPWLLIRTNATFLNLCFIASNFYAVLVNIRLFGVYPGPTYFYASGSIVVGLVIYSVPTERSFLAM